MIYIFQNHHRCFNRVNLGYRNTNNLDGLMSYAANIVLVIKNNYWRIVKRCFAFVLKRHSKFAYPLF